jgi:hypothetical protein
MGFWVMKISVPGLKIVIKMLEFTIVQLIRSANSNLYFSTSSLVYLLGKCLRVSILSSTVTANYLNQRFAENIIHYRQIGELDYWAKEMLEPYICRIQILSSMGNLYFWDLKYKSCFSSGTPNDTCSNEECSFNSSNTWFKSRVSLPDRFNHRNLELA